MDNKQFYYEEGPIIKKVRPWALIITLGYFLLIATLDGNWGEFMVRDIYLKILESLLITMVAFLYGSRGVEKVSQIMNRKTFSKMVVPPVDLKQRDPNEEKEKQDMIARLEKQIQEAEDIEYRKARQAFDELRSQQNK